MSGRLEGKVAIVTGAGTGLGEAIAHRFAREGAAVLVAGMPANGVHEVAAAIASTGSAAHAFAGDSSKEGAALACVAAAVERFGRLNVLVDNARVSWARRLPSKTTPSRPSTACSQRTAARPFS